jgi:hypothetical protein
MVAEKELFSGELENGRAVRFTPKFMMRRAGVILRNSFDGRRKGI